MGLNPESQWASRSHIPALAILSDEYEITGVANSNYKSAQKAAAFFKIPKAYESASTLIHSEDNDLIVITVRVPYHYELVKVALEAGKHVYCEHPLGNGIEETRDLAAIAASKDVVAVVGTQMVVSPDVLYLEKLIREGYVGKVLSTTLIGSGGPSFTGETVAANYYLSDKTNGATMLTIPLAHTLSGVMKVLGEYDILSSLMLNNFPDVKIRDTGETKPKQPKIR
nr:Gfo/Idh/MocA family oxidoreductase [Mucilaginibacter oryzae]